jgi:hypothetical protein
MPKTAKEIITDVVELLNNGSGDDAKHLWSILTALRGPDFPDTLNIKYTTTGRIRSCIGMDGRPMRGVLVSHGAVKHIDRTVRMIYGDHFVHHFNLAVDALTELGYINKDGIHERS